jgi:hypothetical protein
MHSARQRREQWIERKAVAAEEPADERRDPWSLVAEVEGEGKRGGEGAVHVPTDADASPARHHVRVPVGEDDHVAGDQLDLFFADQAPVAMAFGQDVVRDQVFGIGHDAR